MLTLAIGGFPGIPTTLILSENDPPATSEIAASESPTGANPMRVDGITIPFACGTESLLTLCSHGTPFPVSKEIVRHVFFARPSTNKHACPSSHFSPTNFPGVNLNRSAPGGDVPPSTNSPPVCVNIML